MILNDVMFWEAFLVFMVRMIPGDMCFFDVKFSLFGF